MGSTLLTRRSLIARGMSVCAGSACTIAGSHLLRTGQSAYFTGTETREFRIFRQYGLDVPDPKVIAYPRVLWMQWLRKTLRYPNHASIPVVGSKLSLEYENIDPLRTTLKDYKNACSLETQMLSYAIDWEQVGSLYHLDSERKALVKDIGKAIDGRALMAIALTEHRVGRDGSLNRDFFDFRLRCGGSEFIERIPAEADHLVSYGPYQLTSRALYDTNGHRRGASIVNQALPPDVRVPGSVSKLRGKYHARAAYLFAVHNMAFFVSHLKPHSVHSLAKAFDAHGMDESLATLVAASHYQPRFAFIAGQRWLSSGRSKPLITYTRAHVAEYAAVAAANHAAL